MPVLGLGVGSCYSTGDGAPPPRDDFYFPVGLQVSAGGTVLYAINSDFDLQYNGGTIQSYDLGLIRRHTLEIIDDPRAPDVPLLDRDRLKDLPPEPLKGTCMERAAGVPTLGETCAPPVRSSYYVRDSAIIGAFATDLLLSPPPSSLRPQSARPTKEPVICPAPPVATTTPLPEGCPTFGNRRFDRLFAPVRGTVSITWASIERDGPDSVAGDPATYGPFLLQCGKDSSGRCNGDHAAGSNTDETGNTRHIAMPGEPFGVVMSEDGKSLVVTHQSETKTSLFSTGLDRDQNDAAGGDSAPAPSLQFVLDGLPLGGIGLAAVPHDRDAFPASAAFPKPAYLQTSNFVPEVDLLRQYPDQIGGSKTDVNDGSSLRRPYLDRESAFGITVSAGGQDSRGIVIDPTPRIACKAKVRTAGRTPEAVNLDIQACAQKPARVFIANRSPASLIVGEIGGSATATSAYDPDRLVLHGQIPLSAGPSRLYLAPIVDRDGAYALRVFVVCFDSATVFVYDPETELVENVIRVGLGPFAMAFDPFNLDDVATHAQVPPDPRFPVTQPGGGVRRYRFGYLASFTNSFVQILDLDNAAPSTSTTPNVFDPRPTFERVVFTLGRPTTPKGS